MTDICLLDVETISLHPDAPIWEFAAIRRSPEGDIRDHFFIHHDPDPWMEDFPDAFKNDYLGRYDETVAYCEAMAARTIWSITHDTVIVGCNPGFDVERLTKLLERHDITPAWHYHPLDIASVAIGYLAARGQLIERPWKSDALSKAVGVDAAAFERHTALGDVLWMVAQWDQMMPEDRDE